MKTKKIAAVICCSLLLATLLTGCFPFNILQSIMQNNQIGGADGPTSIIVSTETPSETPSEILDISETPSDSVNSTSTNDENTQRIGSVEHGYVDVPSDYVNFVDPTLSIDLIQYSDMTGTNIVTLAHYDENQYDDKSLALAMLDQLKTDSAIDQSSVTGATVTLDGCDAYQVYGYYPNLDLFLVIWFLDSPHDEYIHYISVEFTSDNYNLFEMVEDTYHVTY